MWRKNELVLSFNVGFAFMMTFLGFDMKNFTEEAILHSIGERFPGRVDPHAGYYGLGISYAAFTAFTLVAPVIIQWVGSKWTLFLSSVIFTIYMAGFIFLNIWVYYAISVAMGIACGLIFTALGVYISEYTSEKNAIRNNGIVWAVVSLSFIIGAALLYILFNVTDNLVFTETVVRYVFGGFAVCSLIGNVGFFILPNLHVPSKQKLSTVSCINKNIHVMADRRMQILVVTYIYMGVYTSYMLGIYPTCMLFSESLRSTIGNKITVYYGIVVGVGEIGTGMIISYYTKRTNGGKLLPIVFFGLLLHVVGYALTFLAFYKDSKFEITSEKAFIDTSLWISLLIGFLVAAGDNCWNTVRGAYLTTKLTSNQSQVFAMSKFWQSIGSCATYFVGEWIDLHGQLIINTVLTIFTAFAFYVVVQMDEEREKAEIEVSFS